VTDPPDEETTALDPVVGRFLGELERRLGIGIVVHAIDAADDGERPMRVEATFMLDIRSTDVTVEGGTEAETWDRLARAALAWKNEDQLNLRIFGGG
jgi:hypothetical protein